MLYNISEKRLNLSYFYDTILADKTASSMQKKLRRLDKKRKNLLS